MQQIHSPAPPHFGAFCSESASSDQILGQSLHQSAKRTRGLQGSVGKCTTPVRHDKNNCAKLHFSSHQLLVVNTSLNAACSCAPNTPKVTLAVQPKLNVARTLGVQRHSAAEQNAISNSTWIHTDLQRTEIYVLELDRNS